MWRARKEVQNSKEVGSMIVLDAGVTINVALDIRVA